MVHQRASLIRSEQTVLADTSPPEPAAQTSSAPGLTKKAPDGAGALRFPLSQRSVSRGHRAAPTEAIVQAGLDGVDVSTKANTARNERR
jgi:hypothetical protein